MWIVKALMLWQSSLWLLWRFTATTRLILLTMLTTQQESTFLIGDVVWLKTVLEPVSLKFRRYELLPGLKANSRMAFFGRRISTMASLITQTATDRYSI